jgi:rhamnose transport system ATP-binding protein
VEIAKALSVNAKILIMDEPTAALSRRESEELYDVSRKLRNRGTSIILISHRFEDIFGLADRATVLRDGKYIGTWDIGEIDESQLVGHMVGRDITHFFPKKNVPIGEELLAVDNISRAGFFRDVSLSVRAGEIVGLTGLVGAGRTEVVEAIAGVTQPDAGRILIKGEITRVDSPYKARAAGMGLLPEDRQSDGLLLPWSINHNVTLPILERLRRAIFISNSKERALSTELKQRLMIKANDVDASAESLSGGNQQKVVVAKQLAADPNVIILDEPTKGVDVGSKAAIYEIMSELVERGIGILMVSSEMPEILNMSDRVYVMRGGRISAEFPAKGLKQERVLAAAVPEYGAREAVVSA